NRSSSRFAHRVDLPAGTESLSAFAHPLRFAQSGLFLFARTLHASFSLGLHN
ncbi:hypothetical protein K443DRAFT_623044, partial [Laccaria amethystina LaAM-08-1]